MKKLIALFLFSLFISCDSSELKKDFNCSVGSNYSGLKKFDDFRNLFAIKLPKKWKVNLYYDNGQTSIYAADTTLSLTKTTLLDASIIHSPTFIDATFKQKVSADNTKMKLQEVKTKDFKLFNKDSYYSLAKGKKGKYPYHILNVFTKVNSDNFLHVKTEVYGDDLVDERICKAINLINEIQLK
ncbi:hypothetical protein [Tenacibaculum halocynthiae]|uniref:hypothetical protein n=1 Tax=Tenacibaculum halocynthiae TaxID=1254437 RepID=UPI003894D82A